MNQKTGETEEVGGSLEDPGPSVRKTGDPWESRCRVGWENLFETGRSL